MYIVRDETRENMKIVFVIWLLYREEIYEETTICIFYLLSLDISTVSISRYYCILLLLLSLLLLSLLLIIVINYYYYYCHHDYHSVNGYIENVKTSHGRERNFGTLPHTRFKRRKKKWKKATQGPTVIVHLRESSDSINLYHNVPTD